MNIYTPITNAEDLEKEIEIPSLNERAFPPESPEWGPDLLNWLRDNLDDYELYLLHAAFHDRAIRNILQEIPVDPKYFSLEEHRLVMSALLRASALNPELPYPPKPEELRTFLNSAAKEESSDNGEIDAATKLLHSLENPDLKSQHYLVTPCLLPWIGDKHAKKAAWDIRRPKIADVVSLINEVDTCLAKTEEAINSDMNRKFDYHKRVEEPEIILSLNSHPVCTPGNISNIQGPSKSGKSSIISSIIASAINTEGQEIDSLGFSVHPSDRDNPKSGAVLHFDTEQSQFHRDRLVRMAYKRANLEREVAHLESHLLTGLDPQSCWQHFSRVVKEAANRDGGIKLIIIDGIADFCVDPNDAEACFELIRKLHSIAMRHQCAVLTVLHENPGSNTGKTRGHLGSQLERKVETALRISKDAKSGMHVVWADKARSFSMPKSAGQHFVWSDDAHMHVSVEGIASASQESTKLAKFSHEVTRAFEGHRELSYTELYRRVMKVAKIATSTAKDRVTKYQECGLVEKCDNQYSLIPTVP